MAGRVVTFYSYKGGVGRSFALANIAVILAQWGCRVLVVDWDIEAPGLNHYFAPLAGNAKAGVLDFLTDCRDGDPESWARYAMPVDLPGGERLQLMPAAAGSDVDYTKLVQQLDWDALYREHDLGTRLETLRTQWTTTFDMILVDSRTGVTDFSGLTTAQLPDILAFMFTANWQSLSGCADVARRAMEARRLMPFDRPAILPLPIVARFEQREEYDRAQVWRKRFASELNPFIETWAPRGVDPLKLIDLLTIPYVPRWTFGEDLACLSEPAGSSGTRTSGQAASYACETLAALLWLGFAKVDLLVSSRDEYVHAARLATQDRRVEPATARRIFVSYSRQDAQASAMMPRIASALQTTSSIDTDVFWDAENMDASEDWAAALRARLEEADGFVVLIGPSFQSSAFQQRETEWMLRLSLRSDKPKAVVPIVLEGGKSAFLGSRLADYNAIFVDSSFDLETQLVPVVARFDRMRGT